MKTSPFIRIREKNSEIKALRETIFTISSILTCVPTEVDIIQSVMNLQSLQATLTQVLADNEELRKGMGQEIANRVEREMFSVNLENVKLKDKVVNLQNIIDNKDNKIINQQEILKGNRKGFWDFLYKLFNVQ